MNPKAADGILLLLAWIAIVAGVWLRWGLPLALIWLGILLIFRVIGPPIHALLKREVPDA